MPKFLLRDFFFFFWITVSASPSAESKDLLKPDPVELEMTAKILFYIFFTFSSFSPPLKLNFFYKKENFLGENKFLVK